jgi:hypothetical protein
MSSISNNLKDLKNVLDKIHEPESLDSHPWTKSLIVLQSGSDAPEWQQKSPGQRLVYAIAQLFTQMMPTLPPRHGKRLDTHWGEFGILAAQYFAPLLYGSCVPASLREAWAYIDESISLFVYGKTGPALSDTEKNAYKLVGDELSIAPNSTLSDWNRKGLERLNEMILRRENYLSGVLGSQAVISQVGISPAGNAKKSIGFFYGKVRLILSLLGVLLLGGLIFLGITGWQAYQQARLVWQDAVGLRALMKAPGTPIERIDSVGPHLATLRQDFEVLKNEAKPFLWMGTWLGWVPHYGGDLASVKPLMYMADALIASADTAYEAATPFLTQDTKAGFSPERLTEILVQAQPQLIEANRQLNLAQVARSQLVPDRLSPQIHDLVVNDADPLISLAADGLNAALEMPRLLGATGEGPKSYLLLAENEDELRPTGGFITAVGTLIIDNGRISNPTFEDVYSLDNWSKPYPAAPWQLQQYMDTSVLVLRDSSWFTDFPTAALYAETMYSYASARTVDGVIAFDQQFLVELLDAVGPIKLEGEPDPIGSNNILAYMRGAKNLTEADIAQNISETKPLFLKKITDALEAKLLDGSVPAERLFSVFLKAMDERHVLLEIDSQSITEILARHRWDGAVRPETGDFLMEVDANVGFNKTSSVVETNLTYDVDLTRKNAPEGSLTVVHKNDSDPVLCSQSNKNPPPDQKFYPVTDCYWNYLRVYVTAGAKLLDAAAQFVPANWMIVKQDVPARVDNLDEKIVGVETFGTLQVVPGGESVLTRFHFALPASIIQLQNGNSIYQLVVQKQPGTRAVPVTIRIHLPDNVSIKSIPQGAVIQSQNVLFQTNLQTDLEFEVVFKSK